MLPISVVVPLYNKQYAVRSTLECLFEQDYPQFEVVIVDDGSIDDSANVVKQLIIGRTNFRLISQPNKGVSAARNYGIQEARYEHIAFLDADDYWVKDYLTTLAQLINDFPDAGLWGVGWNFMINGKHKHNDDINDTLFRDIVPTYWSKNRTFSYWTSASCTTKSILNEVGCFDERISYGEDIDLWFRILLKYKGAYYAIPKAYYVQDSENRIFQNRPKIEKNIVCYIDKYVVYRENNLAFRQYFDQLMAAHLFPYLDSPTYKTDKQLRQKVNYLRAQLDKSTLSCLTILRLYCPVLFRIKRKMFSIFKKKT